MMLLLFTQRFYKGGVAQAFSCGFKGERARWRECMIMKVIEYHSDG